MSTSKRYPVEVRERAVRVGGFVWDEELSSRRQGELCDLVEPFCDDSVG